MPGRPMTARRAENSLALRSVERNVERRPVAAEDEVLRLIDACFELVQKSGNLEPRVGEIVAAAGLSNRAFYRYFRSKDELLLAVLDEGVALLAGYLEHRMSKSRTPERRIRQWLSGLLEQALNAESAAATRPFALSRGRLSELFPEEVERSEKQLSGMLREAISQAVAQGVFSDASPERARTDRS